MSNVYITEPPTDGKILIKTTVGDIEVELWSKEAPKACRNIIALALEGYYDGCMFHRVVPGFCVQTGDPTGTGAGGESVYGEPFEDEFHQRLRFSRRGLLAMANAGERNSNDSQFFFTLDAAPELYQKHTLFGRVVGNTIFNMLAIANVELSTEDPERPVYPPRITSVQVLSNPFDDIVPRITREEKLEQERAKREAAQRRKDAVERKKVKKNTALLSFGEAEETPEDVSNAFKGPKSSHDLLNDKRLRKEVAESTPNLSSPPLMHARDEPKRNKSAQSNRETKSASREPVETVAGVDGPDNGSGGEGKKKRKRVKQDDGEELSLVGIREKHAKAGADSTASQIQSLEASIRSLTRRSGSPPSVSDNKKKGKGASLLEEQRRKYLANSRKGEGPSRKRRGKDDDDVMAQLKRFQSRVRAAEEGNEGETRASASARGGRENGEGTLAAEGAEESEFDDNSGSWLGHRLTFRSSANEDQHTADEYEVLDPREEAARARDAPGSMGASGSNRKARESGGNRFGDRRHHRLDGRRAGHQGNDFGRRERDRDGGWSRRQ